MNSKIKTIIPIVLSSSASVAALLATGLKDKNHLFGFIIALLGFPFVITFQTAARWKWKYGLLAMLFLILYLWLGVRTLAYLSTVFGVFFFLEFTTGKINFKTLIYLLISTPFFDFVAKILSFPIRIKLTNAAVLILQRVYPEIHAQGNIIFKTDHLQFSVDPECMGLNMLSLCLLAALVVTGYLEKSKSHILTAFESILSLAIMLVLAIFANLLRIISLVVFESFPETFSHELIGILCLVLYALVPFYLLSWFYFKNKTKNWDTQPHLKIPSEKSIYLVVLVNIIIAFTLYFMPVDSHVRPDPTFDKISLPNYEKTLIEHNILKLKNEEALVYIKPSVDFFGAHHSPLICWEGSGYQLQNERIKMLNGYRIAFAQLQHEGKTLQTAWWFDNGKNKDCDGWNWRVESLKGADPYRLINVTCKTSEELEECTKGLLKLNLFNE